MVARVRLAFLSALSCLVFFHIVLGFAAAAEPGKSAVSPVPVFKLGSGSAVTQWLVVGPFPKINTANSTDPLYFLNQDYLRALGGEVHARLTSSAQISYRDEAGTTRTARIAPLTANGAGIIDLNAHFGLIGPRVAYAFAMIDSPSSQTATCFLGSGDGIKVWVDGQPLQARPGSVFEQSCIPRQIQFPVPLRKGLHPMLVKVDNTKGDWAFIMELAAPQAAKKIQAELDRQKLLQDFQNESLIPDAPGKYIIAPGPFPRIAWKDPALVEKLWGRLPLRVRWFDRALNEVKSAEKPGRYAAYLEGKTRDGRIIRRALTLFCAASGDPLLSKLELSTETLHTPTRLVSQPVWDAHRELLTGLPVARFFNPVEALRQEAVILAGLADLTDRGTGTSTATVSWSDTPDMLDIDYHYRLKQRLLGHAVAHGSTLAPPRRVTETPAPTIRPGSEHEAGVKPGTAERLRAVCRDWAAGGGESFSVLVARHGVIILNEAFNVPGKRPVDIHTRLGLDSITKTVTSLLFLQFLDQGLVRLEDPVGKYLPDLPERGPRVVTLHNCVTHTSGLEGHGAWGGMANPWLENDIGTIAEMLRPGEVAIYNGMGFDLAGKVMERIAGKNIFRIYHENYLDPLGLNAVTLHDLAFTAECNAEELARLGQLMLNRGSYGPYRFFSPQTFEKMMPRPATAMFPKIPVSDWEYGIGLSWMRCPDPDAGKNGVPKDKMLLGRNIVGHGALCSTLFAVDLDHDIVIAMPRSGGGKDYGKYEAQLYRAIEAGLE